MPETLVDHFSNVRLDDDDLPEGITVKQVCWEAAELKERQRVSLDACLVA